jgi:replicative DNA helicase
MDSDVVMFIYREDMYVENSDRPNVADVIVAKQRKGPTGVASLYFRADHQHFSDLKPMERIPLEYTGATHMSYAAQGVDP